MIEYALSITAVVVTVEVGIRTYHFCGAILEKLTISGRISVKETTMPPVTSVSLSTVVALPIVVLIVRAEWNVLNIVEAIGCINSRK